MDYCISVLIVNISAMFWKTQRFENVWDLKNAKRIARCSENVAFCWPSAVFVVVFEKKNIFYVNKYKKTNKF